MSPDPTRSPRRVRLRLLAALLACLALFAAAACGDDDDVTDGETPPADATPTPAGSEEPADTTPTPADGEAIDGEATPTPAEGGSTDGEATPTPADDGTTDEGAGGDDAAGDDVAAELAAVLRDNGLSSLATAVEQVDLDSIIGEEFTFFAPSDDAFLALGADDTAEILTDPGRLVDVLQNHVLDTTVGSDELATMDSVETRLGETLTVSVDGDTVTVGDATVTTADLEAGGGVIHIVDRVLVP